MANALTDVENTFLSLDENFDMLLAGCKNDDQRNALKAQYQAADENYNRAVDKILTDDDAQVAELLSQLKPLNDQVTKAVTEMGNISQVISIVTQAVSVGSQLLKL